MDYDYSDDAELPKTDRLSDLGVLAGALENWDHIVADLEQQLENAKSHRDEIAQEKIPELMEEIGMEEFKMASGRKIKVRQRVFASFHDGQKGEALAWLDSHGHGGLVKGEVVMPYLKGQDTIAEQAANLLRQTFQFPVTKDRTVHHQTLSAWAKRQLEKGEAIPESIKVSVKKIAEIS